MLFYIPLQRHYLIFNYRAAKEELDAQGGEEESEFAGKEL